MQEMLSYLAAALPADVTAAARLVALQCALRMGPGARLWVPRGLLRSLRLGHETGLWHELEQAQWLRVLPPPDPSPSPTGIQLLDHALLYQAPGRRDRAHAADWALRTTSRAPLRVLSASLRLTALALAAHMPPGQLHGAAEADQLARA
ncbi:hypothetical protein [Streptomyces sp. 8N616]|uniref:hypothetical protein n=1 Tax=Streptomyces sp. 8N616 TaxID=3457414 RepID=UPI003FD23855